MKHISELLETIIPGLQANHDPHPFNIDAIRKEKACLIEDLFKTMKSSCNMNPIYIDLIGKDAVKSFDDLYDMSIYDLELLLAHLSAELKCWMKECQQISMRNKFIPNYRQRRNQFRSGPEDDLN